MKDKIQLHNLCSIYIKERVNNAQNAIINVQSSANEETKSTAGDKHDTARAMMQIEVEKNSKQLANAKKLQTVLSQINPEESYSIIKLGSTVETTNGNYFLAISAGKLQVGDKVWFAISPVSPIGQLLLSKKEGDNFIFNGKSFEITIVR